MSGILDSKKRMLDTILTQEGRRQLAQGALRLEFVSFTDGETFYEADSVSGSSDASERIFYEACDLPHDQITFEADDSGRLVPYRGSSLGVLNGKVLSGSTDAYLSVVSGSEFASVSGQLLASQIDAFNRLFALRTDDVFFDEEREFDTNINEITFIITDDTPFRRLQAKKACIDKIESLFQDKRLSHIANFMYLPPVNNAQTYDATTFPLGNYPVIGQRKTPMTYSQLAAEISERGQEVIEFAKTSLKSNVVCQLFEIRQDQMLKLDVIDFGEVMTDDPVSPVKRVFFAGKIFVDSFGAQTFVNIFDIIFE
jgi:hypothetical protein